MKKLLLFVCAIFFTLNGFLYASTITYTDRATWQVAAGGGLAWTENFETYSTDTSFENTTIDVGPFSLTSVNSSPNINIIDVTPFIHSGVPATFGDVAANMFVYGAQQVTLDFDTSINSFFGDFLWAGNSTQLTLELSSGDQIQVPGTGIGLESFGFISTDLITSIIFKNTVNDGFMLDNIAVGGAPIPEPATIFLFSLGLLGLAGVSRKKQ